MWKSSNNKRKRLSGIFANSAQVLLGAIFVSNFFKEGGGETRIASIAVLIGCYVCAFVFEPNNGE